MRDIDVRLDKKPSVLRCKQAHCVLDVNIASSENWSDTYDREYEDFTVAIADNNLEQYKLDGVVFENEGDKDIAIISHFLKRSTRNIELKSKIITYNQLNQILNRRGLRIENPNGNRIDLIRFVGFDGAPLVGPKRIAHIGFHRWSKQISEKDIKIVREASKLDARHGYDSQSFFNGLDDPLTLIKKYKGPLDPT
jgi:hypothetical protein